MGIGRTGVRASLAALTALGVGIALLAGAAAAAAAPPPHANPTAKDGKGERLEATIRRTDHGIPHILADDPAGVAFGYGYAFAEDNICTIAETYVTVRAERSRHFGPEGSYLQRGNGLRPTTSTPTSSSSGSSTTGRSRTCSTSRRHRARSRRSATPFAAMSPDTTSTSPTPGSTTSRTRAAGEPIG